MGAPQALMLGEVPPAVHLIDATKAEVDTALQFNALVWLEKVVGQPLPRDVPLEELLQNAWLLGRLAEILGAMREGKLARLSAGDMMSQLLGSRPHKQTLADFQSYYKLFDDLRIPRDNLVSLADLRAGRNMAAVCRSLWDLQLALAARGVQVPEFECCDLRRSTSMTRKHSSLKVALFDTTGSPLKLPNQLHVECLSVSSQQSSGGGSSQGFGHASPSSSLELEEELGEDPSALKSVGSLRRWLPGERPGSRLGSAPVQEEAEGEGEDSATSPWVISSQPTVGGCSDAAAPESPAAPGSPAAAVSAASEASSATSLLTSQLDGGNALEVAGASSLSTAVAACKEGGHDADDDDEEEEKAVAVGPLLSTPRSPLSDGAPPGSASDAGSSSPGQYRLSPSRIDALGMPNPAFSPADSAGAHLASGAPPAAAGAAAAAALGPGGLTPACPAAAPRGPLEVAPAQLTPPLLKLSPPDSKEPSPEGLQGGHFLSVLVSPEKPVHVQLINALMGAGAAPAPAAGKAQRGGAACPEVPEAREGAASAEEEEAEQRPVSAPDACPPPPHLLSGAAGQAGGGQLQQAAADCGRAAGRQGKRTEERGTQDWGALLRCNWPGVALGLAGLVAAAGLARLAGSSRRRGAGRREQPARAPPALPHKRVCSWDSPALVLGKGV